MEAVKLKKFAPFNNYLLNIYQLTLKNIKMSCFTYLIFSEITQRSFPFYMAYDSPVPSINFHIENVTLEDIQLEKQTLFYLKDVEFLGSRPDLY